MLSEAEAWREIARRIAEGETTMTFGLCAEFLDFLDLGIPVQSFWSALDRVEAHASVSPDRVQRPAGCFAFPPGKCREERILAALFLALEAEDELAARVPEKEGSET